MHVAFVLPVDEPYRPGSHGPEHDGSVSPATCPYWPALPEHRDNHDGKGTKEKHTDIAWLSMNPAGFTSIVPFFSTYGQATHATLLVASVMLLYVPAGHLVQGHPHNIGLNNMQNQDTNKPHINTSHTQSHTQRHAHRHTRRHTNKHCPSCEYYARASRPVQHSVCRDSSTNYWEYSACQ